MNLFDTLMAASISICLTQGILSLTEEVESKVIDFNEQQKAFYDCVKKYKGECKNLGVLP